MINHLRDAGLLEMRRLEKIKNLQHRIQVNIEKKNGTKESVVGSCIRRVSAKLINLLFGEAREMVVLKPGKTVRNVIINEIKGEEVNG